jgi:DNA-binding Xre family transcriptional regulator
MKPLLEAMNLLEIEWMELFRSLRKFVLQRINRVTDLADVVEITVRDLQKITVCREVN